MSRNQFDALCSKYLIDPAIALENEEIVEALKAKDDAKVEQILKTQF